MPVSKLAVVLALSGALPALAEPAARPRPSVKVAVMEIRPLGTDQVKADLLSEVALTEAYGVEGIDVIGRSDIAAMLNFEQKKRALDCAEDAGCFAQIGGALGVEYLLIGSLGRLGNLFRLDLKLVETRRASVLGRIGESIDSREEALVSAVQRSVRQLLDPIAAAAPGAGPRVAGPPRPTGEAPDLRARPAPNARPELGAALPPPRSSRRVGAWISAGAGLALGAGGIAVGLAARAAFDDEKAAAARGDLPAYGDAKGRVRSLSRAADGLFLGGALCAGLGTWLFLTPGGGAATFSASPRPGGAVAVAAGEF